MGIHVKSNDLKALATLARVDGAFFSLVVPQIYQCVTIRSLHQFVEFYNKLAEWMTERDRLEQAMSVKTTLSPSPRTRRATKTAFLESHQLDRIKLYMASVRHIDIDFGYSTELAPYLRGHEDKWSIAFALGSGKLILESLHVTTRCMGHISRFNLWFRAVLQSCSATHLRVQSCCFCGYFEVSGVIDEAWIAWSSNPDVKSLDIPFYSPRMPLEKGRWLVRGIGYNSWQLRNAYSYLFLMGAKFRDVAIGNSQGWGPQWLVYMDSNQVPAGGFPMEQTINELKQKAPARVHLIKEPTTPSTMSVKEWREWLKEDVWGCAEKESDARQGAQAV